MLLFVDSVQRTLGVTRTVFPVFGGLSVGLLALAYPEILYWGFQNVDILLESRPSVAGLSVGLLVQLVVVKIAATSLCRASGLVGGYYAPSLFIGASTGMAYGKIVGLLVSTFNPVSHFSFLEVASPQAYGLVGMAATLAGVCQVPLTAVLLLFELTQDYRIVLPLLGAVGLSSWITSGQTRKRTVGKESSETNSPVTLPERYSYDLDVPNFPPGFEEPNGSNICEIESSLCLNDDSHYDAGNLAEEILVSQAMRAQYVSVLMSTPLTEVVSLMLNDKQSCALIVNHNNQLIGLLTLGDIQDFIESARAKSRRIQVLNFSELCSTSEKMCSVSWIVTPNMSLRMALSLMDRHDLSRLPVILDNGDPIGLLDRESIDLACRAFAIQEGLSWFLTLE